MARKQYGDIQLKSGSRITSDTTIPTSGNDLVTKDYVDSRLGEPNTAASYDISAQVYGAVGTTTPTRILHFVAATPFRILGTPNIHTAFAETGPGTSPATFTIYHDVGATGTGVSIGSVTFTTGSPSDNQSINFSTSGGSPLDIDVAAGDVVYIDYTSADDGTLADVMITLAAIDLDFITSSNFHTTVDATNPVAHWTFGDAPGSSTAVDRQGNVNLTATSVQFGAQGSLGNSEDTSVYFEESTTAGVLTSPDSSRHLEILGDLTIIARVFPTDFSAQQPIIRYGTSSETEAGNFAYIFSILNATTVQFFHEYGAGNNQSINLSASVPLNAWSHLEIRRKVSTKTIELYLNGELAATNTYTNDATGATIATVYVGNTELTSVNFKGMIDELIVYDRIITDSESQSIYRAAKLLSAGGAGGTSVSAAGSTSEIQFNDNGDFDASSNLTWDGDKLSAIGSPVTDVRISTDGEIEARKVRVNPVSGGAGVILEAPASVNAFIDLKVNSVLSGNIYSDGTIVGINSATSNDLDLCSGGGDVTFPSASTQLLPQFGTFGLPTYSFDGDNTTGMYRSASNELSFTTGGTLSLSIESDGTLHVNPTLNYETLVLDDDDIPNKAYVDSVAGGGGGGISGINVKDEGVDVGTGSPAVFTTLDFAGSGVSVTDGGSGSALVTVEGSSGVGDVISSAALFYSSIEQTTNLNEGDTINLDTTDFIKGTKILRSGSTITLQPGTYSLKGSVGRAAWDGVNGLMSFAIYNTTGSPEVAISIPGAIQSTARVSNGDFNTETAAIVTVSTTSTFELRINGKAGTDNLTKLGNNQGKFPLIYLKVEEIINSNNTATMFSDFHSVVDDTNPLVHWTLDEAPGASTAVDRQGLVDLTALSGVQFGVEGSFGNGNGTGVFVGTSGALTSTDTGRVLELTGDMTVVARIFPRTASNNTFLQYSVSGETEATNTLYQIDVENDTTVQYVHEYGAGNNEVLNLNVAVPLYTWSHIELQRDTTAKTIKVYLNGRLADTQSYTNNPTGGTSATVSVGASVLGTPVFNGMIDEMIIYDRVITSTESQAIYNAAKLLATGAGGIGTDEAIYTFGSAKGFTGSTFTDLTYDSYSSGDPSLYDPSTNKILSSGIYYVRAEANVRNPGIARNSVLKEFSIALRVNTIDVAYSGIQSWNNTGFNGPGAAVSGILDLEVGDDIDIRLNNWDGGSGNPYDVESAGRLYLDRLKSGGGSDISTFTDLTDTPSTLTPGNFLVAAGSPVALVETQLPYDVSGHVAGVPAVGPVWRFAVTRPFTLTQVGFAYNDTTTPATVSPGTFELHILSPGGSALTPGVPGPTGVATITYPTAGPPFTGVVTFIPGSPITPIPVGPPDELVVIYATADGGGTLGNVSFTFEGFI